MKRAFPLALVLLATAVAVVSTASAQAAQPDRWLHVRVDNADAKGEMVRVNVPLSLAEKVLPTINNERIHHGKVTMDQANVHGVDLRALLDAVRAAHDGEFVNVQGSGSDVHVAKEAGYLLVHVRENKEPSHKRVEIRVPLTVANALLSAGNNELDLVAAIRALAAHGDTELVTVKDAKSTVRIWVDSKNTAD